MKGAVAFACALAALWCAIGGVVVLLFGWGVVEVVAVELAGVVLAVLAAGLWVADTQPSCGHVPPCSDVRGSR